MRYLVLIDTLSSSAFASPIKRIIEKFQKSYDRLVISSKELQIRGSIISVNNKVIYPDSAIVLTPFSYTSKYELDILKINDFIVDSYPSSIRIAEDKTLMFNLLKKYVLTPEVYYKTTPEEDFIGYYITSDIILINQDRLHLCKYQDEVYLLPQVKEEDPIIPSIRFYCFLGEPLTSAYIVHKLGKNYYQTGEDGVKEMRKEEVIVVTHHSSSTPEYSNYMKHKEYLQSKEESLKKIARFIANYLMLGSCDIELGLINGVPVLLDVEPSHSPLSLGILGEDYLFKQMYVTLMSKIHSTKTWSQQLKETK